MSQVSLNDNPLLHLLTESQPWTPPPRWQRYAVAVGSVALALAVSLLFRPVFERGPFLLFFLAVAVSAAYGGLKPGIVATVGGMFAVNYFFTPPFYTLLVDLNSLVRLLVFFATAAVVGWLYERRQHAEESAQTRAEWFYTTLTSVGDGMIATDTQGHIIFMNTVAAALTGWNSSEAVGRPIQEVFHVVNEATRQPVDNPVLKVLERGVIVGLANHTVLIARDGTERAIDDSGAPIRNRRRELIGTVLIFRDVTASRQAETAVRDARAQLSEILESIDDAFYAVDKNWRFTYINQKAAETWGKTPEALVGQNIWEVFPGGVDSEAYHQLQQAMQTRHSVRFETYSSYLNEWVSVSAYPGQNGGLVVYFRDITERKRREEHLQTLYTLTAQLSQAVTLDEVGGVITSLALRVLPAKASSVSLLSETRQEMEVRWDSNMTPETRDRWQVFPITMPWPINDVVRTGKPQWFETRAARLAAYPATAEFEPYPGAWAVLPLNVKQRTLGAITIAFQTDRAFPDDEREFLLAVADQCAQAIERARLYEQAREIAVHEERQRLARDLHDAVSQTLFSASMISESLPRLWQRSPDETLAKINQLNRLTRGAMAEMRNLLLELRPTMLLNSRMGDLLQQLTEAIKGRKNIAFSVVLDDQQPLPEAVHVALYRIGQEALNNMVKHSQASEASVIYRSAPDRVELTISDNGIGFDITGTQAGFGMSTMRERAEAVNARLNVTSQPGQGTTVSVIWEKP
ncbi:MAG: PAS domain S-box protein [Chloroflexi bacterium]|nr:PAS domain S-box protein [Chloroflexota bacterium]